METMFKTAWINIIVLYRAISPRTSQRSVYFRATLPASEEIHLIKKHDSECIIWVYVEKVLAAPATKAIVQRLAYHRVVLISRVTIKRYSSVTLPMRKLLSQIARCIGVSFFSLSTVSGFRFQAKQNRSYRVSIKVFVDTRRHDKVMINYPVLLVCSILRQISRKFRPDRQILSR